MINTPLRILLVEDFKTDADLIIFHLHKIVKNLEVKLVDNLKDFKTEMNVFIPDLVLSDYNLPTCSGLDVLNLLKQGYSNTPLIFITGTLESEEMAANTILAGASGFILKKNMSNLQDKLKPLIKKAVFNMSQKVEIREKIRNNRIAVNQIYRYLDDMNSDNAEHKQSLLNIKESMDKLKLEDENDARTIKKRD